MYGRVYVDGEALENVNESILLRIADFIE